MTAVAETNGHVQPIRNTYAERDTHLAEVLAAEIADLRTLLDDELEGRAELEQLIDRSKERERRLARAIAVLEHGSTTAQPTAQAKPKPKPAADKGWTVSETAIERVRVAFLAYASEHPDAFTMTTLNTWMTEQGAGASTETLRRAFDALREREIIRIAGKTRGGGKLWAPMPDAVHAD